MKTIIEYKHTPGPWRVKSSNRTGTLEIIGGTQYHHVCSLLGNRTESHFHAQQANAALIAAAPELLENIRYIESCTPTDDQGESDEDLLELTITRKAARDISAAMARAEGREAK